MQAAARYQVDVYDASVTCDGGRARAGAPAPSLVRTYGVGMPLTFDVASGRHTIVLTAFSASDEVLGSGCQSSRVGVDTRVCLSAVLAPSPEASTCGAGGCSCVADGDCAAGYYCGADASCHVGCRTVADCPVDGASDGGNVAGGLAACSAQHSCVPCQSATDCQRASGCQDNQIVAYDASAIACVAGVCSSPTATTLSCPHGCSAGACSGALTTLANVRAQQAGTTTPVAVAAVLETQPGGGWAPATRDVEVLVNPRPPGSSKSVTVTYILDGNFNVQTSVALTRGSAGGVEQWTGTIPSQPAGTRVFFYVTAVGWDGAKLFAPGSQRNYAYKSN